MSTLPFDDLLVEDVFADPRMVEHTCRQWGDVDSDEQGAFLDAVALKASSGSQPVLHLLLTLVDQHRLAIPAIRRSLADTEAVNDVAQDVLIALANSIGSFRGSAAFRTWLFSVARNQTFRYIRHESKGKDAPLEALRPAHRISSLVANREILGEALEQLPPLYREAVVLRDMEQLTYQQIADQLSIELNTVRSRIARGRALIASGIADFS